MKRTDISELKQTAASSNNLVFFTGAGLSTDSGIPDFRSPGTGLWNNIKPVKFNDFIKDKRLREDYWDKRFGSDSPIELAVPNSGHEAIARLVNNRIALGVITQNVDNLHQDSGIPPNFIVELHGNSTYATCLSCRRKMELYELRRRWLAGEEVSLCDLCGGIIKAATISFGQDMPREEMSRATCLTETCDLMIVVGSSLVVYPAAGFPQYAKERGALLAIINNEPTPLDDIADIVINRPIGEILPSFADNLLELAQK